MVNLDSSPVTVRGPHRTTGSGVVTFARIFVHDDALYVAEGTQRGAKVSRVTAYPIPEGSPEILPGRRSRPLYSWGPWTWDSCGCASGWKRHKVADLLALVTDETPAPVPAGEIPDDGQDA
jgi:hypothetical protein